MHYDFLVVGGGSAGCVLAARLSEDDARTVCLVEAGPDYGAPELWPEELRDPRNLPESHQWDPDEAILRPFRAKVLGGCSTHNACLLVWDDELAELEPYRQKALDTIAPEPFFYAEDEFSPWFAAVSTAARARGLEVVTGPFNIRDGVRWNAAFAYIEPARARENLTIRANTLAERIVLDGSRAIGVVADGEEIRADTIIVSAGTVGSARLLLRSGIDAGSNLQDHVSTKLVFETTDALLTDAEFAFATGLVKTDELHLLPVQDRRGTQAHITVALLRPHSRGRVDLERIDHGLLTDERDREGLEAALQLARELSGHEAIERLGRPVTTSLEENLGMYFHPVGTCADVVGADLRVQGFENFYVCDASVFETIPRANTHLPTLALAEKLGSEL